jgi:HlyD family secretion protein
MQAAPPPKNGHDNPDRAFHTRMAIGFGLVALLALAIGGWAANSQLSGAVIASGQVVVESSIKKVQHPTGGVVGEIRVKNGDHVEAGDILMRLDETQTRANLGIVVSQMTEMTARKARLAAERDGTASIDFPAGFEEGSEDCVRAAAGERRLFEAKRKNADGKKAQLRERVGQYRHEVEGLTKQEKSKATELSLVTEELARLQEMYDRNLVPVTRVLAMRRDVARIEGEHGSLISQIARVGGQIYEAELQIIEVDETIIVDAQKEYREVEAKLAEFSERQIAAEDQLKRIDIRAPRAGIVHELAVHTVGGVIGPGDVLMGIVPLEDQRSIEIRLSPTDIDQVTIGQKVVLRFAAFNQRTTPELKGAISRVAADVTRDPQSGASYYTAGVDVTDEELARLGAVKLVAGMPVEAFIQTGERTALSFLMKPVTDQIARAFKEE